MGDDKEICVKISLAQGISDELVDRLTNRANRINEWHNREVVVPIKVSPTQMGLNICGDSTLLRVFVSELDEEANDNKEIGSAIYKKLFGHSQGKVKM
jgi:hypothetical protein